MRRRILLAHRLLFWFLVAFTLANALRPGPSAGPGLNDKLLHFLAFYVLSLSAACAAPRLHPVWIGAALLGLGIAIEILQMAPLIGRSASFLDLLADLAGIAAALVPAAVYGWRARVASKDDQAV